MATADTVPSEAEILAELLSPHRGGLSSAAAHDILGWQFSPYQKKRMRQLSEKARQGALTEAEDAEMDNYERVGHLIGILQSKARATLGVPLERE